MAPLNRTVHAESENINMIKNQIQDTEKSWFTFQPKMRTYLCEGTFDKADKEVVKSKYIDRKESYWILRLDTEDQHSVAIKKVKSLVIESRTCKRLKNTLDIIEEGIVDDAVDANEVWHRRGLLGHNEDFWGQKSSQNDDFLGQKSAESNEVF